MLRHDPPWQPVLVVQVMVRPLNSVNCPLWSQTRGSTVCQLRMKGVVALALLLGSVRLGRSCQKVDSVLICNDALTNFVPGCTTMFVGLKNIGEISSTMLQSVNLSTVNTFEGRNAGITGIAEKAFSSFSNLTTLILNANHLSNINPNWFSNPATISELELSFNQIQDLNETSLMGLSNLEKLRLNENRIQTVHPESFSSQSRLTHLDLSKNRLTTLSPQIFRSLKSLKSIRFHGNPWNCSCDALDFVDSLKELNKSQLVNQMSVTCETPPHLKGQPVLNVSVCSMAPTPGKPSRNRTTTTTHRPQELSGKTETTFQPKPTDLPGTTSADTATLSSSGASMRTRLPDVTLFSSSTGLYLTSSVIHPASTKRPVATQTAVTGQLISNTKVCSLIAVIVVLCVLLLGVCFMALMHRRNRSNKAVRPGGTTEEEEKHEGDSTSSQDQAASPPGHRCPEEALRTSFTGIRAKSANAIILSSPFCGLEKDKVTSQTELEVPLEKSGEENLISGSGAKKGEAFLPETSTGGIHSAVECVTQEGDIVNLYENQERARVYTDVIPYLSIGAMQNKPNPAEESAEGPGQSPQRSKRIRRISTWPPTAAQWQARCKRKEEDDEEEMDIWTQSVTVKIMTEHPSSSEQYEKEVKTMNLSLSDSFKPPETPEGVLEEEGVILDPESAKQNSIQIGTGEKLSSDKHPAQKNVRKGQKQSVTTRQRAENSAADGSKAPSGGASPDDETLLSGNEYAFMDLLHEVVQNNGRWTRERWKQVNVNKQRR